jgi:hypothetical protein
VLRDLDGASVDVTMPLPDDLAVVLKQLERCVDRRGARATQDDS